MMIGNDEDLVSCIALSRHDCQLAGITGTMTVNPTDRKHTYGLD
jgi:hypothetical protein